MIRMRCGLVPTHAGVAPWGECGAGVGDDPPARASLAHFALLGLDQVGESCVWFALLGAVWAMTSITGHAPVVLDPFVGYWATRRRAANGGPVVDAGCRPTDAAQVLRELGFSRWAPPFAAPVDLNAEPAWGLLCGATDDDWFRLRRVVQVGPSKSRAIKRLLSAPGASARPVLFGQAIDAAYPDWRPGMQPWRRTGDIVGRHMELAVAYDEHGLHLVDSWGRGIMRHVAWQQVESVDSTDVWEPWIDFERMPR